MCMGIARRFWAFMCNGDGHGTRWAWYRLLLSNGSVIWRPQRVTFATGVLYVALRYYAETNVV